MFEAATIFQRTHAGREEIHQKKKGLTQSVRLVLIMVDGVTCYSGVRAKLPVLTKERFERAMRTLQEKELILEVFLPVDGQPAEEVERTVIDLFLQQDPMDPVTVFMLDPEEMLESPPTESPSSIPPPLIPPPSSAPPRERYFASPAVPESAIFNQQDVDTVELIGMQARERQRERPTALPQSIRAHDGHSRRHSRRPAIREGAHWGYWTFAIGLAFLTGYTLARIAG